MTLHGVGEPLATKTQRITQALRIELYRQWQTYNNGVHMTDDTFNSIDFGNLAFAAELAAANGNDRDRERKAREYASAVIRAENAADRGSDERDRIRHD